MSKSTQSPINKIFIKKKESVIQKYLVRPARQILICVYPQMIVEATNILRNLKIELSSRSAMDELIS